MLRRMWLGCEGKTEVIVYGAGLAVSVFLWQNPAEPSLCYSGRGSARGGGGGWFATRRPRRCSPASESEVDQQIGYTAVRLNPAWSKETGRVQVCCPVGNVVCWLGRSRWRCRCVQLRRPFKTCDGYHIHPNSKRPWLLARKRHSRCYQEPEATVIDFRAKGSSKCRKERGVSEGPAAGANLVKVSIDRPSSSSTCRESWNASRWRQKQCSPKW